jgi:hypothetical protein
MNTLSLCEFRAAAASLSDCVVSKELRRSATKTAFFVQSDKLAK